MIFAPHGKTLRPVFARRQGFAALKLSLQKPQRKAVATFRHRERPRSAVQNKPFHKSEQAVLQPQQAAVATRCASTHCATWQTKQNILQNPPRRWNFHYTANYGAEWDGHRKIHGLLSLHELRKRKRWHRKDSIAARPLPASVLYGRGKALARCCRSARFLPIKRTQGQGGKSHDRHGNTKLAKT